jgi:hypothetical protein
MGYRGALSKDSNGGSGLPSPRFSFYCKDALGILGNFRGSDNSALDFLSPDTTLE